MSDTSDTQSLSRNEIGLIERMRSGDKRAFDTFFHDNASRLASFAARRCALDPSALEDVVQQTLIKAIRNLAGFRGECSLFTWLCQICRHVLADARRKAARQPALSSLDALCEEPVSLPVQLIDYRDPLDACSNDSLRSAIRQTINDLPPRYGRILELKYGDELSISDIGRLLCLSDTAAQSLLARARRAFGDLWRARDATLAGVIQPAPPSNL